MYDEMGNPVRERVRLARSRTCDDEQRPSEVRITPIDAMFNGEALLGIERCKISRRAHAVLGWKLFSQP